MYQTRLKTSCKRANRRYIYAGSQSVGEVRNQQLSHSLMTGLQMDEHIARIALNQGATPQVKSYLTDALGSVIATAKADQSLEVGYAFSPYGQTQKVGVENQQPGSENSSQYTGRENDGNGLYFYRARYYDPVLKRFISEDPIGLAGGINSHAYVEGDPVSNTDPTGLATQMCKRRLSVLPFRVGPAFHQYICVPDGMGGKVCGGLSTNGSLFNSPGVIEYENKSDYSEICEEIKEDNTCMEQCVRDAFMKPPPNYSMDLSNGDNCQTWANNTTATCQAKCVRKK